MNSVKFKTLDVRPMLAKGVEPFAEIRKRVDALAPGAGLTVVAPFMPAPLIEKLQSEGFSSRVERHTDGAWAAFFWRE
ncbi:MAG: hypothetical protein A3G75_09680 [Verrucomicrobia bacterium RIFCSPLOWO2_12_FULL_64_8]|nr:MAG: hypothetical protein A3G75_09680 [Verrucomicrobia bacterium RIFCSPLOWO2_12_FULL_64_8]